MPSIDRNKNKIFIWFELDKSLNSISKLFSDKSLEAKQSKRKHLREIR